MVLHWWLIAVCFGCSVFGVSFEFPIFNVVLVVLILDVGLMGWAFCCVEVWVWGDLW